MLVQSQVCIIHHYLSTLGLKFWVSWSISGKCRQYLQHTDVIYPLAYA